MKNDEASNSHQIATTKTGKPLNVLTPVKAIRAKCLDCSGWQPSEVRQCTIKDCSLWPYRMGRRPDTSETYLPPKKAS